MIKTYDITTTFVRLHEKREYEWLVRYGYDGDNFEGSEYSQDINEIFGIDKAEDGSSILTVDRDHQGGSVKVEVFEKYDELYDLLTEKSEYLKRRFGEKQK